MSFSKQSSKRPENGLFYNTNDTAPFITCQKYGGNLAAYLKQFDSTGSYHARQPDTARQQESADIIASSSFVSPVHPLALDVFLSG